jgi:hypothetical protein
MNMKNHCINWLRVCLSIWSLTLAASAWADTIECEGRYPHHLQGVCRDDNEHFYWSFTTQLVKTDATGKLIRKIPVANHHGDLCFHDGKVLVAVNLGKFNRAEGEADSWIYVYRADDLSLASKHATPEVVHGAGGIAWHDGKFLVVGGLPPGSEENYAYEYDEQFKFVKRHTIPSGNTLMGIQTAAYADGQWWFGCYGKPQVVLRADESLMNVQRFEFNASLGIVPLAKGRFLIARGSCTPDAGCSGALVPATADRQQGLRPE